MAIAKNITSIRKQTDPLGITLVAVSKTKPVSDIQEAYDAGQRIFGENIVQELVEKYEQLPKDIQWHMVGHLQRNKVKYIAPFISLIHGVDSFKLLQEIDKQGKKHDRRIDCLLQVRIADEETKFGLEHAEVIELLRQEELATLAHVRIVGLMGIATNTSNERVVKEEFYELKMLFDGIKQSFFAHDDAFSIISTGMSSDYKLAIEQGSNMIRLGSTIFGTRD